MRSMMRLLERTSSTTITAVTVAPTKTLATEPESTAFATRPPTTPARAATIIPTSTDVLASRRLTDVRPRPVRFEQTLLIVVEAGDEVGLELRRDLDYAWRRRLMPNTSQASSICVSMSRTYVVTPMKRTTGRTRSANT